MNFGNDPFADLNSDLDGGVNAPLSNLATAALPRYASPKTGVSYVEACAQCGGSGLWHGAFSSYGRRCFACNGTGKISFRTSPEARAKARQKAADTKLRVEQDRQSAINAKLQAWIEANADVNEWLEANAQRFEFAGSLHDSLRRWGSLTEGQMAAARRCMERAEARKAEHAAQQAHPQNNALKALWEVLQRHNRFYAGEMTMSRRPNDQLVWIKHRDAEKVIGKLDNGVLTLWNRPGVDLNAVRAQLQQFEANPLAEAQRLGKLTGRCCSCGRELTDPASIEAGIGPICAAKF